jgi:hypothetical protein
MTTLSEKKSEQNATGTVVPIPTTVYASQVIEPQSNSSFRAQIPQGLHPGDTFAVTDGASGKTFNVVVPPGVSPGSFIAVIIPPEIGEENDSDAMALRSCSPHLTKTNVGAALAGALVGTLILGPIGGIIIGSGAAYATSRPEGSIGHYARIVGDKTFENASKAKKWAESKAGALGGGQTNTSGSPASRE